MTWYDLDTWIVITGAICGASCALVGCFLVLRKLSMTGDAISHAVLPGLAAAYLLSGDRGSVTMFVGAVIAGVLTAALTEWVRRIGRVDEGASPGVVFTTLFAVGLVLIKHADRVDIDPQCVLYGYLESVITSTVNIGGLLVPQAALTTGATLILNLVIIITLYKELKISSFDPALATTLGIDSRIMHYLLMVMAAITTVAAFESVGSILVVACLIVPAATAQLLTRRLPIMLVLSVVFAVAASLVGHILANTLPQLAGYEKPVPTAGMIATVLGGFLLLAVLFAPEQGLLSRIRHRRQLSLRIVREDLLTQLARAGEDPARLQATLTVTAGDRMLRRATQQLSRQGLVVREPALSLTPAGEAEALRLLRSHRLWETYLATEANVAIDHVHSAADRLEHLGPDLPQAEGLVGVERDPHNRPIPPAR